MKVAFFLMFMALSMNANSNDYICVAFKAVALFNNGGNEPSITEVDVTATKYHLQQADAGYVFKEFGAGFEMPCASSSMCSCGAEAWCGAFTRNEKGYFTLFVDKKFVGGADGSAIVKGKCELAE